MSKTRYFRTLVIIALFCVLSVGCAKKDTGLLGTENSSKVVSASDGDLYSEVSSYGTELPSSEALGEEQQAEPTLVEADWLDYFGGLDGCAVVYDPAANQYTVYNEPESRTQHSPCSTFKIISSLVALEKGIFVPEDSVRKWSGEVFWNEEWNRDLNFAEAFRASCVWYFRKIVDEIGQETMQTELNRLHYGNCDISDWEGSQNTNNNNRALTGFWLESSLKISPVEQVEVMERIFGKESVYREQSIDALKAVMLTAEESGMSIYGKTGMGKAAGEVVDAWFTGFAETADGNLYFCVYLGKNEGAEVSSARAKEIALELMVDFGY